jgi:acetylornithine deacetylase/succinyl-diaminopimelate desuccinylase-like protein
VALTRISMPSFLPTARQRKVRAIPVACVAVLALAFSSAHAGAQSAALTPDQTLARDILRELIGINTTSSAGNTTVAAQALAKRLLDGGFPAVDVQVLGPRPKNQNLVARLRGTGARKPILLLAHLDVVEARREDWSLDPFTLTERDGFFYGRGTSDIKDGAAIWVATLIRLKREGYRPDRDIILALTAGEEAGDDYNGVQWLVENHHDLIDAEYCINADAGDPEIKNGKLIARTVQASEKVFESFKLEVHNPGGHSSLPRKDNAIYRLAAALGRLSQFQFPVDLNEVTRNYFTHTAATETGQMSADMRAVAATTPDPAAAARLSAVPLYNALLRTTCVATMLEGGHAENALPQMARATVNCRILPTESADQIQRTLVRIVADTGVAVTSLAPAKPSPPSPLTPAVMKPIEQVTASLWPGVPVITVMETGATDGLYLRNAGMPTYGVSGVAIDIDDVRAHGRDERIGVAQYYSALPYIHDLVVALSSPKVAS